MSARRSHSVTAGAGAELNALHWATVHANAKNGRTECPGCHCEEFPFSFRWHVSNQVLYRDTKQCILGEEGILQLATWNESSNLETIVNLVKG